MNKLCQHAGQLYALQDLTARIDMDGDAVLPEGDRLGLIEKAVDRHAPLLQLLQHKAHRLRGDALVRKIAANLQLIPGKHLGKGRTKTPAQRLIQRFSTAQADHDLSFCAVKLHAVDQHTAERRTELLIRRKLRPDLGDEWFQGNFTSQVGVETRLPPRGKLSAKRTDEGEVAGYYPQTDCRGQLTPHPALRATFPQGGRL